MELWDQAQWWIDVECAMGTTGIARRSPGSTLEHHFLMDITSSLVFLREPVILTSQSSGAVETILVNLKQLSTDILVCVMRVNERFERFHVSGNYCL